MRNPRLRWTLLALVAAVYVAGGLSRISFDVDILKLLPANLPQVEGLSLFLKHFAQPDELMITLEGPTAEETEAAADSLAAALGAHRDLISAAVARPPWETHPEQLAELLAYQLLNAPPEKLAPILRGLAPENAPATLQDSLDELAESFDPAQVALRSYDPYRLTDVIDRTAFGGDLNEFSSADGTFRVVYVKSARPLGNYVDAIAWIQAIKTVVTPWQERHSVAVGYTGEPAFVADLSGNMQAEMSIAGGTTMLIIAGIFWLCYRRLQPLLMLQLMLALTFLLSLATAGWFFDDLTVIGVGFGSVMIGLSVDYGFFVFQNSLHHRGSAAELRRYCLLSIAWTCSTTAAAFFALNFSSLPGLSQLGNLVGVGVLIGACVMLGIFTSVAVRYRERHPIHAPLAAEGIFTSPRFLRGGAVITGALVVILVATLVIKGFPSLDFTAQTLRPRVSGAQTAMDRLTERMLDTSRMLSLVVEGSTPDQVRERLEQADAALASAQARGDILRHQTALPFWPNARFQKTNLPTVAAVTDAAPRLREQMLAAGFNDSAFPLTQAVLSQWKQWSNAPLPLWPENPTSAWILRRLAERSPDRYLAAGYVLPAPGHEGVFLEGLGIEGVYLVSWEQLGRQLKAVVPEEMFRVIAALALLVIGTLAFGLRSIRGLALFVLTTTIVLLSLCGAMSLLGIPFSFFNLAAILLFLGTGTDYSILLLIALRRNHGDTVGAQRQLGLIIALCSISAAAGFGSIIWANHVGLSQLGATCAIGLLIDAAVSLFLLPPAWGLCERIRSKLRG